MPLVSAPEPDLQQGVLKSRHGKNGDVLRDLRTAESGRLVRRAKCNTNQARHIRNLAHGQILYLFPVQVDIQRMQRAPVGRGVPNPEPNNVNCDPGAAGRSAELGVRSSFPDATIIDGYLRNRLAATGVM